MFACEHITVELTGDKGTFLGVDDVSAQANPHEIVDIVGPSGAGKSTFLHALALIIPRSAGIITFENMPVEQFAPQEWRRQIALVQQKPALLEGTIEENLLTPWRLKIYKTQTPPTADEMTELMKRAGLKDIALSRDVAKLSVGQQARVAFMRTVLTKPKVLLLDEVDAALDAQSTHFIGELTSLFAEQGGIVLRVRHKVDDRRAVKRLVFNHGKAAFEMLNRGVSDD